MSVLTPKRSTVSADRGTVSSQRVWVLTALVAVQLWAALSSLPTDPARGHFFAAEGAALAAVLAMFGLRSVPVRWIVRGLALLSGALLARFGELGVLDGIGGSWRVLVWLAVTGAALALSPSSRSVPGRDPGTVIRAQDVPAPDGAGGGSHRGRDGGRDTGDPAARRVPGPGSVPVALVVAAVALVGAAALLGGPRTALVFPIGANAGDLVDLADERENNALVATDRLDMTTRPRLSDEVVMTVRSPLASFWRTETFDEWDGRSWTRSDADRASLLTDGQVRPSFEDIAALDGVESRQEFRIEVGFATAVPTAPSALEVDSEQQLAQRPDGTLLAPDRALSRGTTYSVASRQMPVDPESLRATAAAEMPRGVLDRYAQPPVITERVAQLAQRVTADATTDYDRVRALEGWMDDTTEYSLDAPLSPEGVDVVDHFLFDSRLGWCEQIASSLVVMARSVGIPARLATGFIPGEFDQAGGRFIVRERDAHAWAEVWFPETGWVAFDPTADVPLAGTEEATPGAAAIDWREVGGALLLLVGLGALLGGPVRRRLLRRREQRAEQRRVAELLRTRWDVAEEARIEALGVAAGRARAPSETITRYAADVAELVAEPELAATGARIDHQRYAPGAGSSHTA